jgi:hypothetical protein
MDLGVVGPFELAASKCVRLCRSVVRKGSAFPKRFSNKTLAGKDSLARKCGLGAWPERPSLSAPHTQTKLTHYRLKLRHYRETRGAGTS